MAGLVGYGIGAMTEATALVERRRTQGAKRKRAKPLPRAQRREQLLGVARRMIQRGGIGVLTMSALAEESGTSKPVVYDHFDNSEAVAIALLDESFETLVDLIAERTKDAETLEDYLSIAIDTEFEFQKRDKLVVRSITNGHSASGRVNAVFLKQREVAIETLQELVRQQGASPDVAAAAGLALCELISGAANGFTMGPDAESAKETVKRMVIGAVQAIVPEAKAKPVTPAKILATSRARK